MNFKKLNTTKPQIMNHLLLMGVYVSVLNLLIIKKKITENGHLEWKTIQPNCLLQFSMDVPMGSQQQSSVSKAPALYESL